MIEVQHLVEARSTSAYSLITGTVILIDNTLEPEFGDANTLYHVRDQGGETHIVSGWDITRHIVGV